MSFWTGNAIGTHLEAELADGLAIQPRLLRGSGRGQLDVIDAKIVKGCVRIPGSVVCKRKRSGALGMVTLGTKRMGSQHEIRFSLGIPSSGFGGCGSGRGTQMGKRMGMGLWLGLEKTNILILVSVSK